jgi:hypothetical protein
LNAPSGQLANNALFKNYFRGLYFKVENGSPGNMAMINFKGGTITIYYKEDLKTTNATVTPPVDTWSRVSKTFVLNLTGNTVSLLNNSNENTDYLSAINNTSEASKLYLKGGEGSLAYVDLFGSTDLYGYVVKKDANNNPIDENGNIIPLNSNGDPISGYLIYIKSIVPNGISDELDDLRYPNISSDPSSIYYSKKNRWLINEANLTFYIDNASMSNTQTAEPNRIFLYDMKNKKPLVDYLYDFTTNSVYPKFSKYIHGGILEKENVTNGRGIRYKIRITNHLRNLIKNDSTNVRLGISVTENINNIAFSKRKLPVTDAVLTAPSMSVMSPLGTILYGSNPSVSDDKRLKLEIYYTKPN